MAGPSRHEYAGSEVGRRPVHVGQLDHRPGLVQPPPCGVDAAAADLDTEPPSSCTCMRWAPPGAYVGMVSVRPGACDVAGRPPTTCT
jgi:hypothetical protein